MTDSINYNGGIFRFIPFENNTWIITLLQESIHKREVQLLFSLLIISCIFSLLTVIKAVFMPCTHMPTLSYKHKNSPLILRYSDVIELTQRNVLYLNKPKYRITESEYLSFNDDIDYDHDIMSLLNIQYNKLNNTRRDYYQFEYAYNHTFKQVPLGKRSILEELLTMEQCNNRHNEQFTRFTNTPNHHHHHHDSKKISHKRRKIELSRFHRRSIIHLSVYFALFIMCFIGFLTSCILFIRNEQNLLQQINNLPSDLKLISLHVGEFIQYAINNAYNLTTIHIHNDTLRQSPDKSQLNQFIQSIKYFIAEFITCLTTNLCDISSINIGGGGGGGGDLKLLLLLPSLLRQEKNSTLIRLKEIERKSYMTLNNFDSLLRKYANLNNVAKSLNIERIRRIEHSWYKYRQSLSPFIYHSPTLNVDDNTYNNLNSDGIFSATKISPNWCYISPIIHETKNTLCNSLFISKLVNFKSCKEVDQFLLEFINYCTYLPITLPIKSLSSVLIYDFIPRALNSEHLINDWLPIVNNLSSNHVNFLFETYLKPKIIKFNQEISIYAKKYPSNKSIETLNRLIRYIRVGMTLFFIFLILFCIITLTLYIHMLISCIQHIKEQTRQYNNCCFRKNYRLTIRPKRSGCLRFILCIVSVTLLFFITVSLSSVYLSIISIEEGCVYLTSNHSAQNKADELITEYLKRLIYNIKGIHDFLIIDKINLQIPQNILKTLNSQYVQGRLPLLQSLHINRPFNFTAALNSHFTYSILKRIWNEEVASRLNTYHLRSKLSSIHLKEVYEETKITLKMENSFDRLYVGNIREYLIDPRKNYFTILLSNLHNISPPHLMNKNLIHFYNRLNHSYYEYYQVYKFVQEKLEIIQANKAILQSLDELVNIGSSILEKINTMSDSQLQRLIDEVIPVFWSYLKPNIQNYIIPFISNLLDDMIPFGGLNDIYVQAVGSVCQKMPTNTTTHVNDPHYVNAIIPELKLMGFAATAASISLLLAIFICSLLL